MVHMIQVLRTADFDAWLSGLRDKVGQKTDLGETDSPLPWQLGRLQARRG